MTTDDETLNRLFRALGDTTRRIIIAELASFSRHLATLEEAGLIEIEWQGTTKLHSLNTAPIAALQAGWLQSFMEEHQ